MAAAMAPNEVDVLIVGGGPAGLLAASYLSPQHRVALVERAALGQTKKYWLTTRRRLQKVGLEDCVLQHSTSMFAGSFLGSQAFADGDFSVVDDQRFLRALIERCRAHDVQLFDDCALLGLMWTENALQVRTTCGDFFARLVIDATGGGSPVAKTFRLNRIDGFYCVYGAHLENIELFTKDIVLGYVHQLGDPPPIFEIYPTSNTSGYCAVFVYSRNLVAPQSLASSFEEHCHHNPFFVMTPNTIRTNEKAGAIPIGRAGTRQLKGIVPLGEAGFVQPPLMGTAFNEILEYTSVVCEQLSLALKRSPGIPTLPRFLYPTRKWAQDRFQLLIARILIGGNVETFDALIRVFSRFSRGMIYTMFCNQLTWSQLLYIISRMPWPLLARYRILGH